jgi:methylthioxylose transferase
VALAAVFAADVSQHSRGEVERIWLPFVPWLALAAPGDRRGWLAAQVAVALVLQSAVVSPW